MITIKYILGVIWEFFIVTPKIIYNVGSDLYDLSNTFGKINTTIQISEFKDIVTNGKKYLKTKQVEQIPVWIQKLNIKEEEEPKKDKKQEEYNKTPHAENGAKIDQMIAQAQQFVKEHC